MLQFRETRPEFSALSDSFRSLRPPSKRSTETARRATSAFVRRLVSFHSFNAIPHSVAKMMMLAMWSVQLEKSYLPISVWPME